MTDVDPNPDSKLPEHVLVNRTQWDADAPNWVASGE